MKVVAALIEDNNKYLIAKRKTGNISVLGKWEFPGGKVEKDETEIEAIEREIKEEFDILIKGEYFISNHEFINNDKEIDLRLYKCTYISGEYKLNDHSEYKYVTLDEMDKYDLSDGDKVLVKYLKENIWKK